MNALKCFFSMGATEDVMLFIFDLQELVRVHTVV